MSGAKIGRVPWAAMLRASARLQIGQIKNYTTELHDALDERVTQFKKHVDEKAREYDPDTRDEWYDWNIDEHWELSEGFPTILRHSVFVATYSFLESTLMRVCAVLGRQEPKPIGMKDLRGEGLELARIYLKKVHGMPFPDQSTEWNRLSHYRKIRNCLVHNDGRVEKEGTGADIREFVANNSDLAVIDDRSRLSLRRKGCDDMIAVTQRFLDLLLDESQLTESRKRGKRLRGA